MFNLRALVIQKAGLEARQSELDVEKQQFASDLADALRRERIAQNKSLRECAKAIRVSAPYLHDVEHGRRSITASRLSDLTTVIYQ